MLAGIRVFAEKGYRDATVREICKAAGSSNINAVNYYYGSKEGLYTEILEKIFSHYDTLQERDTEQRSPEEQLKAMITAFREMLYKDNAFTSDITSIFVAEMTRPSPFLEDLVDTYNRPRVKRHIKMFLDLLGENATEQVARDCLVSVAGQLLYYSFAWPVFSRLFPDYSPGQHHAAWAEHVYSFTLGGLEAVKERLKATKEVL